MKEIRNRGKWKLCAAVVLFVLFALGIQAARGIEADAAGETVRLTVGRKIFYGTYSTN